MLGGDGDPLDILVLMDAPTHVGCLMKSVSSESSSRSRPGTARPKAMTGFRVSLPGWVRALRNYMRAANKTYTLNAIRQFPVPLEQSLAILDQRLVENAAHKRYQLPRQ
jgi:hypothetical protein